MTKKISKKGAKLYYSFSPVNDLAVNSNEDEILDFYWSIRSKLSCNVIGTPSEYIIDSHYFYDTNFHMNDAGAIYRTYVLASNIYRDILNVSKQPAFVIPEAPEYPPVDITEEDDSETARYFELIEDSSGYTLVSLKNEFTDLEEITLPKIFNHKYVTSVANQAFSNSTKLKKITIPDSYGLLENGAFDDCLTLTHVYLLERNPSELVVDFMGGLLTNVSSEFKFYVPADCLNAYRADYNWQFYYDYLVGYDYEAH